MHITEDDKDVMKMSVFFSIISTALLWHYFKLNLTTITINLPKTFPPALSLSIFPYLVLMHSFLLILFFSIRTTSSFKQDVEATLNDNSVFIFLLLICFFPWVWLLFYFETFDGGFWWVVFSILMSGWISVFVHFILYYLLFTLHRILISPIIIVDVIRENKQLLEKQNELLEKQTNAITNQYPLISKQNELLEKQNQILEKIAENQNKSS
jgi:hypothetical protein